MTIRRGTVKRPSASALYSNWLDLTLSSWRLAAESQAVVGLRLARLAIGDAAAAKEAKLMVAEKLKAAAEVQAMLVGAALSGSANGPKRAVAHVHRRVRSNRRRLTKRRA